jgi:hypothetical protein
MKQQCRYSDESGHGTVEVNVGLGLCEVGQDCPATECPYRFVASDIKPCPTCKGKPPIDAPPYSCERCDLFGIVRM